MQAIAALGIKKITGIVVQEITPKGMKIKKGEEEQFLEADTIVVAVGARSSGQLYERIKNRAGEVHLIGDAKTPRKTLDAIHEGFLLGCQL